MWSQSRDLEVSLKWPTWASNSRRVIEVSLRSIKKPSWVSCCLKPSTKCKWEFLGTTGFYRLWISGFAKMARLLYKVNRGTTVWRGKWESFQWLKISTNVSPYPGLAWSDQAKDYLRKRVRALPRECWPKTWAPGNDQWPACLNSWIRWQQDGLTAWDSEATALLTKDADKLTLRQPLIITTPHTIEGVLKRPLNQDISSARLTISLCC